MDITKAQGIAVGIGHEGKEAYVVMHVLNSVTISLNESATRFLADQLLATANAIWPVEDYESETNQIEG